MLIKDADATARFLMKRKNTDGGYSFARFGPSTASATYYAISSFFMIGIYSPEEKKTIEWCLSKQRSDGSFASPYVAFYVINTLRFLNSSIENSSRFLSWCYSHYKDGFFSEKPDGIPSLRATYMFTDVLSHYNGSRYNDEISTNLSKSPLPNNLTDIFRYVRIFENIGRAVSHEEEIVEFVEKCKTPPGFYGLIPKTTSFLEHVYHAIYLSKKFDISVERDRLWNYIMSCRNRDGGFGRAPSAASFVQYTYYALKSLNLLEKM